MVDLHPVVTLPHDPILVAEVTAGCIRADARQGGAVPLPANAIYFADPSRGPNLLLSPAETAARGGGQCFDLTRAEGGFRGTHVGCVRTPGGFHVYLAWAGSGSPMIYDVAKLRGMPDEPTYDGAVYVPIWQPGPGGVAGQPGHDQPPPVIGATSAEAWPSFIASIAAPIVGSSSGRRQLRRAIELQLGAEADATRKEALAALLLVVRSADDPVLLASLREACADRSSVCSAQLLGAAAALGALDLRGEGAQIAGFVPLARSSYMPAPVTSAFVPEIRTPGSCPGSCSIRNRRR